MTIPDGYQDYLKENQDKEIIAKTHYLKLRKAMTRQWWQIFKKVLSLYVTFQVKLTLFYSKERKMDRSPTLSSMLLMEEYNVKAKRR
jgi:hypothetical protein